MTKQESAAMFRQKENLCVSCARICMGDTPKGCSWSAELKPVKGWEAVPVYDSHGEFYTWQVNRCPKFVRGMYRPLCDREGMINLLEQALKVARKDYLANINNDRGAIEAFIKKFVPGCDGALEALRKDGDKYDKEHRVSRVRTSRWLIFNSGTNLEFGECEDCGQEVTSEKVFYNPMTKSDVKHYPTRCPGCGAINVKKVRVEDLA